MIVPPFDQDTLTQRDSSQEVSEVAEEYAAALDDLSFNSKPIINSLTFVADENSENANDIVNVICSRLLKGPVATQLPTLYLVDSIVKNVGGQYIELFENEVSDLFVATFLAGGHPIRRSLMNLLNTWSGGGIGPAVFAEGTLSHIRSRIAEFLGSNGELPDPGVRSASAPPVAPQFPGFVPQNGPALLSSLVQKDRHEKILKSLYHNFQSQCSTCGLRFRRGENMRQHYDWHFERNKRNSERVLSRQWYVSFEQWEKCEASESVKEMGTCNSLLKMSDKRVLDNPFARLPTSMNAVQTERVVATDTQRRCPVCGEKFSVELDPVTDEWMFLEAVGLTDGTVVHMSCRADSSNNIVDSNAPEAPLMITDEIEPETPPIKDEVVKDEIVEDAFRKRRRIKGDTKKGPKKRVRF